MNQPRIAVIGSGPSGLYTVAALLASGQPLHVDVIDRLPTPYGLVRYVVAPDHANMKAVTRVLAKPFALDHVRFVGNVEVGRDLAHDDLTACYDAVVYASGTEQDRRLGIPGEQLPNVVGSGEFVRWYNGHPDAAGTDFSLEAEQVAVIGAGNVADLAGRAVPVRQDIVDLLAGRNRPQIDWAGWLRLEEYEGELGAADGRGRVKVPDLESMLRYCSTPVRH